MKKLIILIAVAVSACGGRIASPVALEKSFDQKLSCSHMTGEYNNHQKRLVELTGERKDKPIHNLGMALSTGVIFLDMSSSQKDEIKAILARNQRLETLMLSRDCDMSVFQGEGEIEPQAAETEDR